jgi:hypothetical protein
MRRTPFIALVALLLLVVAGGGIASARHGGSSGSSGSGSQKQVELRYRASKAVQGYTLKVRVKAKHAERDALTGEAVIHFASGDVTVQLQPKSHGRQLRVRVPVAADEALGPITVDVTVTLGGVAQAPVTLDTVVIAPDEDESEDD